MSDWYQQQFDKALTTKFDDEFKKITGLTWLPWVEKILIIARFSLLRSLIIPIQMIKHLSNRKSNNI